MELQLISPLGSGMPICTVCAYDVPVNKIVLAPLPANIEPASVDTLGRAWLLLHVG